MLYNNLATPDRSKTQLAQRIRYFPWANLSEAGRKLVTTHHIKVMSCREIEDELIRHPDFHEVFLLKGEHLYEVVWAFNMIPTKTEWEQHGPEGLLTVEFRLSPAIPDKRVAILRFKREPSIRN